MIALITGRDDLKVNIEGIELVKIESPGEVPYSFLEKYRGVIVDARDVKYALSFLTRVRSGTTIDVFLKPVFVYSDSTINDKYLMEISDGLLDSRNIMDVFPLTEKILEKVSKFHDFQGYKPEHFIALKAMQYMVSREVDLNPVIMPKSKFGYVYPLITVNFPERDDARMFDIVEFIDNENLADSRFVDRIHLCPSCSSSFLNFREICPKCGSANLAMDDLIHHFSCGYVGPEAKFKKDDKLICPKCGKILRHIGMDYDKPSVIYTCNECNYSFQEPEVTGLCMYCGEVNAVENLLVRDIKSFQVSQVTVNCAINGIILSLRDILSETMKVHTNFAFRTILEYEFKKQKRYNAQSVLVYLQFNFNGNNPVFRENRQAIFVEIAHVMRDVLRESDVITALSDNTFAILLLEVSHEEAKEVMERLKERIKNFVEDNFPGGRLDILVEYSNIEEALRGSYFNMYSGSNE